MTSDLAGTLDVYRRGLEAQIALLETLVAAAGAQQDACQRVDAAALLDASLIRQKTMDALFELEASQRPVRDHLVQNLAAVQRLQGFAAVSALHRKGQVCLAELDTRDQSTIANLQQSDASRRASALTLDAGEATLAAYRRILSVQSRSSIVDSRG
jgi:hypothetical protein